MPSDAEAIRGRPAEFSVGQEHMHTVYKSSIGQFNNLAMDGMLESLVGDGASAARMRYTWYEPCLAPSRAYVVAACSGDYDFVVGRTLI